MAKNEFDKNINYRLYRSVKELLHPTISKKNISEYKIIIKEDLLPVYVYYPKKISNINTVFIYIHGDSKITDCENKYPSICSKLAIKTDSIIMAIDYNLKKDYEKTYSEIYKTVKHIYNELNDTDENISIVLAGDSTGCNIINGINYLNSNEISIPIEILFYPVLSTKKVSVPSEHELFNPSLLLDIEEYFKKLSKENQQHSEMLNYIGDIPKTLIIVGNVDPLNSTIKEYSNKHSNIELVEIAFASHGFLKNPDKETENDVYNAINKFLNN